MELLTMSAVVSAVETVTSDALSGATGEFGRRMSEALSGLVRRSLRRDADGGTALPDGPQERRELAERLFQEAARDPAFARDLELWLRDSAAVGGAGGPRGATARPRLLPPGTAVFTDREHVLADVRDLADGLGEEALGHPGIVVLIGPGGIGKTATAVHCARLLAERFPDGQLHADLRGAAAATAVAPSDVLARFLAVLGVPAGRISGDEQRLLDLYRDLTAERRLLVLLDNAHSAAQVAPLLTAAPRSLVMVTSRYRLPELVRDHGARVIRLGPLPPEDSLRLLARLVGPDRVAEGREHAEAVAGRCAGLPLTLCATGARAAGREHLSWERILRDFTEAEAGDGGGDGEREEGAMHSGPDDTAAFRATDLSYRELGAPAARLYRLLGLRPWPDISVGAAAAAAGDGDEAAARALLEELAAAHLVEETGEERYRYHDVIRRHAEQRAALTDGPQESARATGRIVRWYLREAAAADSAVLPGRWRLGPAYAERGLPRSEAAATGLDWLLRERENLAEAVRAADDHGFDDLVWQLCEALWGLHLKCGFHRQWAETHQRGVAAARRCAEAFGDPRAEGRMRVQLAFALKGLGRYEEAERQLARAAESDRRAGHHRGEATALEVLGLLRLDQWRYEEAESRFAEARHRLGLIAQEQDGAADVPRALAILAHHSGRALRLGRRTDEATTQLLNALALFTELPAPDPYNEARVKMSLGETFLDAGDPGAARTPLREASAAMAADGAPMQQAECARLLARCAMELSEPRAEAEHLRTARALYARTGNDALVARIDERLRGLGAS
ncbi:ATP-binding protein [Streptomyces johnsoniae]|uniref:Tetratricopeptide repeat protein n=1 Tax=Streptomyces johnsoniae TaxID=3075532 RepID=A0ABU2S5Q9_9ACTN|nr:tetratricopeptide repeat protein [Streptomyces sp. DSM 41886]MDT0444311.1 tetratricopeptide repeat protein [Streptomyces sp. DSM 41886]